MDKEIIIFLFVDKDRDTQIQVIFFRNLRKLGSIFYGNMMLLFCGTSKQLSETKLHMNTYRDKFTFENLHKGTTARVKER